MQLTRSRAYKSNEQAWVEQKNGMLVRRVVGHRRLEGPQQLERLCQLYAALRLFTNIYQPSAKRIPFEESGRREGRRPRRRHDQPLTPADRLLRWSGISRQHRESIEALQQQCDPVVLLETIRWNQAALVNRESEPSSESDRSASNEDLNAFLGSLRLLWRQSEPAKRGCAKAHLPHAGGSDPGVLAPGVAVADGRSFAHRPTGDATARAGTPWAVSRQPSHVAEADG